MHGPKVRVLYHVQYPGVTLTRVYEGARKIAHIEQILLERSQSVLMRFIPQPNSQ